MKLAGLLFGAGLAGIAVYAFYALTSVDDDDLLATILRDHCLPYVTTGTEPFTDLGRTPGVYDEVDLLDTIENGGARLIYDNRFTAQWGEVTGAGQTSRICDVKPTYGENTVAAFVVDTDTFLARTAALFAEFDPLEPSIDAITEGPTVMGFYGPGRAQNEGLRAAFIVAPGLISGVSVLDDLRP